MDAEQIQEKVKELQAIIDRITARGFWMNVYDTADGQGRIDFLPYRLEVLGAKPVSSLDGQVKSWRYALLMINSTLIEKLDSEFNHHLFIVERIEWEYNVRREIYSGHFFCAEPSDTKFYLIGLDRFDFPEESKQWEEFMKRVEAIRENVDAGVENIKELFAEMAEGML
jgi:hypothetical protein